MTTEAPGPAQESMDENRQSGSADVSELPRWHTMSVLQVVEQIGTDQDNGLTAQQASRRWEELGPNEIQETAGRGPWRILWEQLRQTLVVVLLIAGIVSAWLGDGIDAIAIFAIVALNALLGLRQEYRAERAMAALKKLTVPQVHVRRNGRIVECDATLLTVGDVVLLEAGSLVPADGRLVATHSMRVDEASLTGESEPVEKTAAASVAAEAALGDRINMAYLGTLVTFGRGELAVTDIGMQTELGGIAGMIQSTTVRATPLQTRLSRLGRILAAVVLAIVAFIFVVGWFRTQSFEDVRILFLTSISLAVAAVPEGLPAVVTIALALGAQKMLRQNALIRKLPAVETLGSVTVICSDKTGTLTKNKMSVEHLQTLDLAVPREQLTEPPSDPALRLLLTGAALCNDARLQDQGNGPSNYVGEPTEVALLEVAESAGIHQRELEQLAPRESEAPFDSDRKRMTTFHLLKHLPVSLQEIHDPNSTVGFTKGAVDSLLELSSHILQDGKAVPLTPEIESAIQATHDEIAGQGMRVLGLSLRVVTSEEFKSVEPQSLEDCLTFVGMFSLMDPPREEAFEAVKACASAGIRPVMITGDHAATAESIGSRLGIGQGKQVVTGQELDTNSDNESLDRITKTTDIYARVTPRHKLQLVESLQRQGHVVAMTGDGVNDAPALKRADIGIAMGITGTDVSKEAADVVLRDDNFATIVKAIKEGRTVFDNIRKFIRYLLSANVGEILVMLIGPLCGMPMPLWPLQILWMNLVTDGFPALALGVEPAEDDVLKRPPYSPSEGVFARGVAVDILWIGLLMGAVSLVVGFVYWSAAPDTGTWQTMLFTTLTFSQMTLALAVRSDHRSLFRIGILSNKAMLVAVGSTIVLQLAVIYWPPANTLFRTVPLSIGNLLIAVAASTILFWAVEARKVIVAKRSSDATT